MLNRSLTQRSTGVLQMADGGESGGFGWEISGALYAEACLEYWVWSTVVWSVGVLRASVMEFGRCAKVL